MQVVVALVVLAPATGEVGQKDVAHVVAVIVAAVAVIQFEALEPAAAAEGAVARYATALLEAMSCWTQ